MAISGLRKWHWVQVEADLTELPQTLDLTASRAGAVIVMLVGGVWVAAAFAAIGGSESLAPGDLVFLVGATLLGVAIIGWALSLLFRRSRAVLSADGVEVTERGLFGAKAFYEPYAAFEGVLHRQIVVRNKRNTRTYQVIELLHADRDRCVPLYVRRTKEMPRARWEDYAKRLKLPALELEEGTVTARQHDELDKSLRDRVADGAVSLSFDPGTLPPDGLVVTRDHSDAFTVAITAPRFPFWFLVMFVLMGLGLMAASFFVADKPVMVFASGMVFVAIPLIMLYCDRTSPRAIRLDRKRLAVDDRLRSRRHGPRSMPFDQIESIALRAERGKKVRDLIIAGDAGRIRVGEGLSREALGWLKNFLTAAIATA